MKQFYKNVLVYVCLSMSFGCLNNIEDVRVPVIPDDPVTLAFAATTTDTWKGLCKKLPIRILDADGDSYTLKHNKILGITSTVGELFASAGCDSANIVNHVAVPAGSSSTTIYYKTSAAGSADVLAAFSENEKATIAVSVSTPTIDRFLGQVNVTTSAPCQTDGSHFCSPWDLTVANDKLWVVDIVNHRVLVWNTSNPESASSATYAIGQPDLNTSTPGTNSQSFTYPAGIHIEGTKLFISDMVNNRVLVWNTLPVTGLEPANYAIGQPDVSTVTPNTGTIGFNTVYNPANVHTDGTAFVVTDTANNRVLVYNTIPMASDPSAAIILGQVDEVSNGFGVGITSFDAPYYSLISQGKLLVCDFGNSRILIWNSLPTIPNQRADVVIGQPDFDSKLINRGGGIPAADSLNYPGGIRVDSEGRLFIADQSNNRILIWNRIPTELDIPADAVIGQIDFVSRTQGVSATAIFEPWAMDFHEDSLWFTDLGNNRVVRMPVP